LTTAVGEAIADLLQEDGYSVQLFTDGAAFLEAYRPGSHGCLLVDALMHGMSGVALIERLKSDGDDLPAIVITGSGAVPMAVKAMKAGAVDFIEKPVGHEELLASVKRALDQTRDTATLSARRDKAALSVANLTARQHQILDLVLAGHPSKNIAADLGISQRTVDNHRAAIMRKTGSKSLPALIRTALAAV
jgi:two-component system, chemotaxis family, CheB/CheR fusion protein